MEPWFIFALISALGAGLYSFSSKISAHLKFHSAQVTMYSTVSATVLSGIYALVVSADTSSVFLILSIAVIDAVAYGVVAITRIDALKHIDSMIFFPLYKVISSILAVPLGILFFSDVISTNEFLGIGIGLLAPIFLITKKEKERQGNLKKGIMLLMIGIVAALVATAMSKIINLMELDFSLYVFFAFSITSLFSALIYKKDRKKDHNKKYVELVGVFGGACMFVNLFFFVRALSGNLGTVYLINSFSTVLVVLLSVIIFKEHINLKKIGALIVTVVSLVLLS